MIRARLQGTSGRQIVFLGLTRGNITRLVDGHEPVFVDGDDHDLCPGTDIAILFGETEGEVLAQLRAGGLDVPQGV